MPLTGEVDMSDAINGNGLVERAGRRTSEPALVQNGNAADVFSSTTMGAGLVERAGQRTAEPALIQNGNAADVFGSKAMRP
jgi:hypothetical protein